MRSAFTLIELLVVITIIVVLLALLSPALEKAIYQAELAVCGANLKGVAAGAQTYAANNARHYPRRPALGVGWGRPNQIAHTSTYDDRTYLDDYLSAKALVDPLSGDVNLGRGDTHPNSQVFANYNLWFRMRYTSPNSGSGMQRLGDRLEWAGDQFNVLASDDDVIMPNLGLHASHPDRDGVMWHMAVQDGMPSDFPGLTGNPDVDGRFTLSRWTTNNGRIDRGTLDTNYAFDDGSVRRYNGIRHNERFRDDAQMVGVPWETHVTSWNAWGFYLHLPPR